MSRLHQLCVLQSRLVVEYVQDKHTSLLQDIPQDKRLGQHLSMCSVMTVHYSDRDCTAEDTAPSPKPMARSVTGVAYL